MGVGANVTGVTRNGQSGAQDDTKTAQDAVFLRETLGSWRAVAEALAPHHRASAAAWWAVARGEKITPEKAAALATYLGKGPKPRKHYAYSRPCLDAATLALLDARRRDGESRGAALKRILEDAG